MQGADTVLHAHMNDEILRPYAGIIRIRFLGMISATVTRAPLQIYVYGANIQKNSYQSLHCI